MSIERGAGFIYRREWINLRQWDEIDEMINHASKNWKTTRMAKAELSILRLAAYEIKYEDDIPVSVSINEAVELAKLYGSDHGPAFVNGILSGMV